MKLQVNSTYTKIGPPPSPPPTSFWQKLLLPGNLRPSLHAYDPWRILPPPPTKPKLLFFPISRYFAAIEFYFWQIESQKVYYVLILQIKQFGEFFNKVFCPPGPHKTEFFFLISRYFDAFKFKQFILTNWVPKGVLCFDLVNFATRFLPSPHKTETFFPISRNFPLFCHVWIYAVYFWQIEFQKVYCVLILQIYQFGEFCNKVLAFSPLKGVFAIFDVEHMLNGAISNFTPWKDFLIRSSVRP